MTILNVRWVLKAMTGIFVRERRGRGARDEGHFHIETEIGVMFPQAKERQEPPEAKKGRGKILP